MIVFQTVNDIVLLQNKYTPKHGLGLGIPIIERFAEEANGTSYIGKKGNKFYAGVKLPEYLPDSPSFTTFNTVYRFYDTGIPDIVEIKMREVIDFFG